MKKNQIIIKNIDPLLTGKFIVGGYLRDLFLNMEPNDTDFVVVGSSEDEMFSKGYKLVGKDFPVFLDHNGDQIALARIERKTSKGYKGFQCETNNVTLHDDLLRRDLTINSIAIGEDGIIYDPFDGIGDINNKVLKHTSVAFKEDPVRVLRLARLYAKLKNFVIDPSTKELVLELREELKFLTPERILKEVEKAMSYEKPELFFICLKELNVLDILFPEIYNMIGVEHNSDYHKEGDVFNHTMLVLQEVCLLTTDVDTRIAALYHDVLKPIVFERDGNFHEHYNEELLYELSDNLFPYIRKNTKLLKLIHAGILYHHFCHNFYIVTGKRFVKKMFTEKAFPKTVEEFEKLLIIARSDSYGRFLIKDGLIIPGSEDSHYDDSYMLFMIDLFKKLKQVNIRDFLIEKPNASVNDIKQKLHNKRIKMFENTKGEYLSEKKYFKLTIKKKYFVDFSEEENTFLFSVNIDEDEETFINNYFINQKLTFDALNDCFKNEISTNSFICSNISKDDFFYLNFEKINFILKSEEV